MKPKVTRQTLLSYIQLTWGYPWRVKQFLPQIYYSQMQLVLFFKSDIPQQCAASDNLPDTMRSFQCSIYKIMHIYRRAYLPTACRTNCVLYTILQICLTLSIGEFNRHSTLHGCMSTIRVYISVYNRFVSNYMFVQVKVKNIIQVLIGQVCVHGQYVHTCLLKEEQH